jgi:transcriptional regulator with XRE-family HTH domain
LLRALTECWWGEVRATPEQSYAWLRYRMQEIGVENLRELAVICRSDKGNISRIFHQQQVPRVDALEPLAIGLQVSVYELLVRVGAIDPDEGGAPTVLRVGETIAFHWPSDSDSP